MRRSRLQLGPLYGLLGPIPDLSTIKCRVSGGDRIG